jgi:hypothetical protein
MVNPRHTELETTKDIGGGVLRSEARGEGADSEKDGEEGLGRRANALA